MKPATSFTGLPILGLGSRTLPSAEIQIPVAGRSHLHICRAGLGCVRRSQVSSPSSCDSCWRQDWACSLSSPIHVWRRYSGKAGRFGRRLTRRPMDWTRKLVQLGVAPNTRGAASAGRGFLSVPWYPWVIVAVPILHFLASNQQQFAAIEAMAPLMIALVVVTASVVCLRLLLSDWHRPAAVAAVATVIIFGYGHVRNVLDTRIDESVLFALAFVLLVASVGVVARAGNNLSRWAQFFNLVAAVLLLFPTASLVGGAVASRDRLSLTDGASAG